MKTTARMAIAFVLGWATPLFADTGQGTTPSSTSSSSSDAPNMSTMTPEMWFYIQEWRRHDDPAQAVRRKAEFRAEQRRQRLAVRKWYGYSKIRPRATATPWTSSPGRAGEVTTITPISGAAISRHTSPSSSAPVRSGGKAGGGVRRVQKFKFRGETGFKWLPHPPRNLNF